MQLPPELYSEIGRHIPLSQQPAFRRVSWLAHQSQFDLSQCCRTPTNFEVVDWLLQQQPNTTLSFQSTNGVQLLTIANGQVVGQYFGHPGVALTTRAQILEFLRGPIILDISLSFRSLTWDLNEDVSAIGQFTESLTSNWLAFKAILGRRLSCLRRSYQIHRCYLARLVAVFWVGDDPSPMTWFGVLTQLSALLTPTAVQRLEADFRSKFTVVPLNLDRPADQYYFVVEQNLRPQSLILDPQQVSEWLMDWIIRLAPHDLR